MIEFIVARLQHDKERVNTQPSSWVILFNSGTVTDVEVCTIGFMGRNKNKHMTSNTSDKSKAEKFVSFFMDKIINCVRLHAF